MSEVSLVQPKKVRKVSPGQVISQVLSYTIFILWAAITILPLFWMGYSSFKSNEELTRDTFAFPSTLFNAGDHKFRVIPLSLNVRVPAEFKDTIDDRVILESTSISPGRRLFVFYPLRSELPQEIANIQPGDIITGDQLHGSMERKIGWELFLYNYSNAFERGGLGFKFMNSLLYAGLSTFLIILFALMIGFAVSKLGMPKLSNAVTALVGVGYLISINSVIIPLYLMLSSIGLTDTRVGIILVYTAFGLPLATMLTSQFIKGLPDSLIESAYIDGASVWKMFTSIIVPMTTPVIVTAGIISALGIWNEFLLVLVLASSETTKSLPVGVYSFSSLTGTELGWQLAALVIAAAPAMIVYFAFNKRITQGVVGGAIKG
ncbi:carbohydrate ABC transporter permease [Spirochaeta lutea]|uniref:ABC transporter n=1 Tax=Spirochaeta lutea TaxID=1480694 RepID=A0A098QUX4_9SPIO|nr:carbohydrate ABC transporter permease [Spirochaeta lutea]KGE71213.1 ABC transporter [Spirochaeta lutea]